MPKLYLPENMEKYRALLENQHILAQMYVENKSSYILEKNRAEKKRWKASKMQQFPVPQNIRDIVLSKKRD